MFQKTWLAEINRFCVAFLLSIVLVMGGLGWTQGLGAVSIAGGLVAFIILAIEIPLSKSKQYPAGMVWYGLFLASLIVSLNWSQDRQTSLEYSLLFSTAGLFALVAHWLSPFIRRTVMPIWLAVGAVFTGMWTVWAMSGKEVVKLGYSSLIKYASDHQDHNHIGDFGVVVVIAALTMWKKSKGVALIGLSMGVLMIGVGHSRSSLLSLSVVLLAVGPWRRLRASRPWVLWLAGIFLIGLFLWFGSQKSLLFSRPYFIQAVAGLWKNPLGVGIGNFATISENEQNHWLGLSSYSQLVHNLLLEVMVGVGWLGLAFGIWWWKALEQAWASLVGERKWFGLLFLAVTVNFLVDTTYFVPTMLWVWLMAWGLLAPTSRKGSRWDQWGAVTIIGVHVFLMGGWMFLSTLNP